MNSLRTISGPQGNEQDVEVSAGQLLRLVDVVKKLTGTPISVDSKSIAIEQVIDALEAIKEQHGGSLLRLRSDMTDRVQRSMQRAIEEGGSPDISPLVS